MVTKKKKKLEICLKKCSFLFFPRVINDIIKEGVLIGLFCFKYGINKTKLKKNRKKKKNIAKISLYSYYFGYLSITLY